MHTMKELVRLHQAGFRGSYVGHGRNRKRLTPRATRYVREGDDCQYENISAGIELAQERECILFHGQKVWFSIGRVRYRYGLTKPMSKVIERFRYAALCAGLDDTQFRPRGQPGFDNDLLWYWVAWTGDFSFFRGHEKIVDASDRILCFSRFAFVFARIRMRTPDRVGSPLFLTFLTLHSMYKADAPSRASIAMANERLGDIHCVTGRLCGGVAVRPTGPEAAELLDIDLATAVVPLDVVFRALARGDGAEVLACHGLSTPALDKR